MLLFLNSCKAQDKAIANVGTIPFHIDPTAQQRIDELWLRNFVDSKFTRDSVYSNPMSKIVMSSILDKDGNLWFGTMDRGIFFYDAKPGKDGKTEVLNFTTMDGLGSNMVSCLYQDKECIIWLGSEGGITRYDGKTFKLIPIPTTKGKKVSVLSIMQDHGGNFWIGTIGDGVYRYDGKHFNQFLEKEGDPKSYGRHNNVIQTILQDSKGNIWFGSMTRGGVYVLDNTRLDHPCINNSCKHNLHNQKEMNVHEKELSISFTNFMPQTESNDVASLAIPAVLSATESISDDMITAIKEDKAGNIWIGTRDNGLVLYDGKKFKKYSTKEGLCNDQISCIYEDRYGNIWFGSDVKNGVYKGGVCYVDAKSLQSGKPIFKSLPTKEGLPYSAIRTIVQDKNGHMWFGSRGGGLWKYDGKEFTDFSFFLQREGC